MSNTHRASYDLAQEARDQLVEMCESEQRTRGVVLSKIISYYYHQVFKLNQIQDRSQTGTN